MKYDAIIFDLFGTLVDDLVHPESHRMAYDDLMVQMASALSLKIDDDFDRVWMGSADMRNVGHFSSVADIMTYLCTELGAEPNDNNIAEAERIRIDYFRKSMVARHDTIDTIERLRDSGHKIGLISDCTNEVADVWPEMSFKDLFHTAILSCEVGLRKPNPDIYKLACELLEVDPKRCMFVGDGGSNELTGASSFGMDAVMIRVPYDLEDGQRQTWTGTTVSSLGELLNIVR